MKTGVGVISRPDFCDFQAGLDLPIRLKSR
jgi:hypothetical protein